MAKPSAFLQRMEAKHRQDMRLQRLFTMIGGIRDRLHKKDGENGSDGG